jgi:hypothetical protein
MKKGILIFTIIIMSFQFVIFQPKEKAQAVGWDTAIKIAMGSSAKQVVRGLGEKIGMKLSGKQLDNMVGQLNKRASTGDKKAIDFINMANSATSTPSSTQPNWKKFALNAFAWVSGADLLWELYSGIKGAFDSGQPITNMCYPDAFLNVTLFGTTPYLSLVADTGTSKTEVGSVQMTGAYGNQWSHISYKPLATKIISSSGSTHTFEVAEPLVNINGATYTTVTKVTANMINYVPKECNVTLTAATIPDVTNVNPTVINHFDNDTYNINNVTYVMEFEAPNYVYDDSATPWNTEDPNIETVFTPPDTTAPNEISNLRADVTNTQVILTWDMPTEEDFSYVRIFRDGELIADSLAVTSYTDSGLAVGSKHDYKITAVDTNGNESTGVSLAVTLSDEPIEKPANSSWWEWLLGPLKEIGDFFKDVGGFLLGILIPSDGFIDGLFTGLFDDFKAKLPVIDQLSNLFTGISEVTTSENAAAPTFEITMPENYGGGTFSIIDFSYFEQWRVWILNFIRFSAWFIFLKRLYNRIPKMIY